ncbi:hypothetical protein BJV74DRAFT_807222 [Russula compacta]|nr:hypothetical protein BJV74DRAFT_807222 [Russula compacta]
MDASKPGSVCTRCGKVFSRKADCNRHSRLHDGIRPHLCEVAGCGKRFAQYTALKTHLNVHTGSKPFKCDFTGCKSAFGDPSSCARHRREIHSPVKPFKCDFPGCTSRIRRSSAFKTHLKKHGLDPDQHSGFSTRDHSPTKVRRSTEPKGIREEQISSFHGSSFNQETPLAGPPYSWDSLFLDSCKSIS